MLYTAQQLNVEYVYLSDTDLFLIYFLSVPLYHPLLLSVIKIHPLKCEFSLF